MADPHVDLLVCHLVQHGSLAICWAVAFVPERLQRRGPPGVECLAYTSGTPECKPLLPRLKRVERHVALVMVCTAGKLRRVLDLRDDAGVDLARGEGRGAGVIKRLAHHRLHVLRLAQLDPRRMLRHRVRARLALVGGGVGRMQHTNGASARAVALTRSYEVLQYLFTEREDFPSIQARSILNRASN